MLSAVAEKCAPEVEADAVPAANTRPIAATSATSASEDFLSDTNFPPQLQLWRTRAGAWLKRRYRRTADFARKYSCACCRRPERCVNSGVKRHLPSRRLQGRSGMRGRCNGPAPRANRGVGLFSGAAKSGFCASPSFRRGLRADGTPQVHVDCLPLGVRIANSLPANPGPETSQRASFTRVG